MLLWAAQFANRVRRKFRVHLPTTVDVPDSLALDSLAPCLSCLIYALGHYPATFGGITDARAGLVVGVYVNILRPTPRRAKRDGNFQCQSTARSGGSHSGNIDAALAVLFRQVCSQCNRSLPTTAVRSKVEHVAGGIIVKPASVRSTTVTCTDHHVYI